MSSNDLKVESPLANVTFTQEETTEIRRITDEYANLYRKAVELQREIEKSERGLLSLATEMEKLKQDEDGFFKIIAKRNDVEPSTVAQIAANLVLNSQV